MGGPGRPSGRQSAGTRVQAMPGLREISPVQVSEGGLVHANAGNLPGRVGHPNPFGRPQDGGAVTYRAQLFGEPDPVTGLQGVAQPARAQFVAGLLWNHPGRGALEFSEGDEPDEPADGRAHLHPAERDGPSLGSQSAGGGARAARPAGTEDDAACGKLDAKPAEHPGLTFQPPSSITAVTRSRRGPARSCSAAMATMSSTLMW